MSIVSILNIVRNFIDSSTIYFNRIVDSSFSVYRDFPLLFILKIYIDMKLLTIWIVVVFSAIEFLTSTRLCNSINEMHLLMSSTAQHAIVILTAKKFLISTYETFQRMLRSSTVRVAIDSLTTKRLLISTYETLQRMLRPSTVRVVIDLSTAKRLLISICGIFVFINRIRIFL